MFQEQPSSRLLEFLFARVHFLGGLNHAVQNNRFRKIILQGLKKWKFVTII